MAEIKKAKPKASAGAAKNQELAKAFAWEVAATHVHFQEIRHFWAKILGISGPQWMILMALSDQDTGQGVSVKEVSKMLHVDASFVTTQSKMLEKKGYVRRRTSEEDARVVNMSLSDKSYKQIANLESRQEKLNAFIFEEFSNDDLQTFIAKLASLNRRLEKASVRVALDI